MIGAQELRGFGNRAGRNRRTHWHESSRVESRMIDVETIQGLSAAQAAERLARAGFNELPAGRVRTFWDGLLDVAREPMTALLIGCGAIYFVLGDRTEATMLLGFVLLIVGTTLYQERKTERAIDALRELASPRALVIRDGRRQRIAGREVVRRRPPRAHRGRPRGRRWHGAVDEPLHDRRVAVDRGVRGGREVRVGPHQCRRSSRWRRPAVRLCRHARDPRCRRDPGDRDRRRHRDGQDRPRPRRDVDRANAPPGRDQATGVEARAGRGEPVGPGRRWSTASRATTGSAACSPDSRSRWRSCRTSFRWS